MTAMWRIVSGGARSCECGCSNVAGVLCPKTSLRQMGDAICPLQLLRFKQSNHDSFGAPIPCTHKLFFLKTRARPNMKRV